MECISFCLQKADSYIARGLARVSKSLQISVINCSLNVAMQFVAHKKTMKA